MSTIGTQLNWGSSYVINDFYRRFAVQGKRERHYVIASQVVTVSLMIISLVATLFLESVGDAWKLLLVIGAGTGPVLLLRWFWWRLNGWSEISAMISASVVSLFLKYVVGWNSDDPKQFAYLMLTTVGITTVTWIIVTLLTAAEPREKLIAFYRKVRPEGPGWRRVAAEAGMVEAHEMGGLGMQLGNWALGCILIYSSLFGIGGLIFKNWTSGILYLIAAVIAAVLISRNLAQVGWQEVSDDEPDYVPAGGSLKPQMNTDEQG
jgi:Na+/proline symporter